MLQILSRFICKNLIFAFAAVISVLAIPNSVKAENKKEKKEDCTPAQTAYVDMSCMGPMILHVMEETSQNHPDYYYAAYAFDRLQKNTILDPMYKNCKQVIVIIEKQQEPMNYVNAFSKVEPKVQTGYLNLLSRETSKYYTIDQIQIKIQRNDDKVY